MSENIKTIKREITLLLKHVLNLPSINKEDFGIDTQRAKEVQKIAESQDFSLVFGIVGKAGSGKSTTLNTLFGLELPVSPIEAGTTDMITTKIEFNDDTDEFEQITDKRVAKGYRPVDTIRATLGKGKCNLIIYDFPGLQYSKEDDKKTLSYLNKYLPECDVILWVIDSIDRAILYDEQFLKELPSEIKKRVVIGISKIDIMPPSSAWNKKYKLPSHEQFENIQKKKKFLSKRLGFDITKIVEYAAEYTPKKGDVKSIDKRFNLYVLGEKLVSSCKKDHTFLLLGAFQKFILSRPKLKK